MSATQMDLDAFQKLRSERATSEKLNAFFKPEESRKRKYINSLPLQLLHKRPVNMSYRFYKEIRKRIRENLKDNFPVTRQKGSAYFRSSIPEYNR